MDKKIDITDLGSGLKGINFDVFGGLEGFLRSTSSGMGGLNQEVLAKRISPWLSRAVDMTSNAISDLPFEIVKDSDVSSKAETPPTGKKKQPKTVAVDSSEDWKNIIGGIENPKQLLKKVAGSLCGGKAYLIADKVGSTYTEFRYIPPHSVIPLITTRGIQWFARASDYGVVGRYLPAGDPPNIGKSLTSDDIDHIVEQWDGKYTGKQLKKALADQYEAIKAASNPRRQGQMLGVQDTQIDPLAGYDGQMIYFWLSDSDIELGPAKTYPLGTALLSTKIETGMNSTLDIYAQRNFVPATMVSAKGMPNPAEREKTETWLNKWLRGWADTAAKIINSDAVSVNKVGAGLDELKGVYVEIMKQAIEAIGAAFGIPAALFLSDRAFATEVDAMIKVWYSSSQFINIYRTIEYTFNEQVLKDYGYKWKFKPETLSAFQEDEATRMVALRAWVSARLRPSIGAELLGFTLPEDVEFSALDENFDKPEVDKPVNPLSDPALTAAQRPEPAPTTGFSQSGAGGKAVVSLNANELKDLALWQQVARRNFKKGKGAALDAAPFLYLSRFPTRDCCRTVTGMWRGR